MAGDQIHAGGLCGIGAAQDGVDICNRRGSFYAAAGAGVGGLGEGVGLDFEAAVTGFGDLGELLLDPPGRRGDSGIGRQVSIHAGKCVAGMEVNQGADGLADAGGRDIGKGAGDGGIGRGDGNGFAVDFCGGSGNCCRGERGEEYRTGKRRAKCKQRAGKDCCHERDAHAVSSSQAHNLTPERRSCTGTLTPGRLVSKTSRKAYELRKFGGAGSLGAAAAIMKR